MSVPVAEIVSSIESGIKHLPPESANFIRAKTTSILKNSKPSRQRNMTKDELETLKRLSKDTSVTILPADKGRAVVVMDSSDYQQKINGLLQDQNAYTKISDRRRNPTPSTEKSLNVLIKQIKGQTSTHDPGVQQLDDKLYYTLRSTDATPATFYGLPKIHKPEVPLRPITSSINCPTYQVSKHLASILSPLQNNKYTVTNSCDFVKKVSDRNITPQEIMVSFDVVSLFTSIPTNLALQVTKNRLEADPTISERTNVSVDNIMRLLEFVLDNNYFIVDGTFYKQIFGCPMGSPVSAILANLVMEHVEERALITAPHPPKWWYRYVDDSHVCITREHLTEFHSHLNSINEHIKFTVEEEKDGSIAFLDTMTSRNPDGTIKTSVYRKATHTDKYLQFNSHHPTQHKRSVARTLLDRAKNIPSTDADKLSDVQHVVDALKINGYTDQFIRSCQSTTVSTNQSQTSRGFVTLPYLQGISEKIARTLNQFNINVAHKPVMTVGSILKKPKEKFSKDLSTGVIYKINCKDCHKVYIGQTSRALRSRTREHKRAIFTGDMNSLLTKHCLTNNHNFDLDDVKIIDRCSQWSKRLFLEAWHSISDPNAINEHIYIPDIYKALGNPK